MKLSQLLYETSLVTTKPDVKITGLSCDSRNVTEEMVFVALESNPKKRKLHIQVAIDRGASFIICPEEDREMNWHSAIYSKNCRYDYGLLSANWFHRPSQHLTIIGVTGTNGKTTTTHILKSMLENLADGTQRKVGLIGTNENKIGERTIPAHRTTPDAFELQSLFREMVDEGCTHVVMEVSSHGLVQQRTAGICFEVGIFTNLTQDHLDYHHSMEAYENAKFTLFEQCKKAAINLDDPTGRRYYQALNGKGKSLYTYSENRDSADLYTTDLELSAQYISFRCIHDKRTVPVYLPIPGGFSLYNALAALTCGLALSLPLLKLADTLPKIKGVKGRIEVLPTPSDFTVLIDYAHTPNALENILTTAQNITENRLICLFGCGGNRDHSKRKIMGEIAEDLADIVVVTSDNPRFEQPEDIIADILKGMSQKKEVRVLTNRREAIFWALSQGQPGDVILLAGKGHECYQEICGEQFHMDERDIVEEYFSQPDFKKD